MRIAATTGAVVLAGAQAAPDVPWWGHLIMALVSVALAFFGGGGFQTSRDRGR